MGLVLEAAGMPFNKALWTPSYNLVTCGTILLAFSLLDYSAISENTRNPLCQLGCNAILFYILSDCCGTLSFLIDSIWVIREGKKVTLISWFKDSILHTNEYPWTIVIHAALQLLLFFVLMRYLYEKRIFIKI
jgi:predicted acyltransferase